MPAPPEVLVVSYRRPDLLERCLQSVTRWLPGALVHVWDNKSDASDEIATLADRHPDIDWHFREENIGFAAAVNRLMAQVEGSSALLLNPDAILLSPLSLTRAALGGPDVAAAVPWIKDGARRPWDNAHREPNLIREIVSYAGWENRLGRRPHLSELYDAQPHDVSGYLTGACLLIDMAAWREVGPFDERYFLYGEEADWCRRARQQGFRLVAVPEEGIEHSAGGTVADEASGRSRSRELLDENRHRYLAQHHGRAAATLYSAATVAMERVQPSKRRVNRRARNASAPDFVITSPTLDFGGAERQRVKLANSLVDRGYRVVLRVLQHTGGIADELEPRVSLVVAPYRDVRRDAGPGTLLVTGTTRIESAYGLAWRTLNLPSGRWVAANHAPVNSHGPTFKKDVERMLHRSDGIIHLANVHRAEHRRAQDIDRGRYWIIPNGVAVRDEVPSPRVQDGTTRFVVASRIEEHKQINLLVRAFSTGLDDLDWTLDIWGDGGHTEAVVAQIPERLSSRIRMRGWCSDVRAVFADADVYCLPSRAEAQPMVILEAMEAGLCVASSPVSSVPEVLEGGAGILVDPPTEERWREVLRTLILDEGLRRRTAQAGRARLAEHYSVEAMTDRYVAMREELTGRG